MVSRLPNERETNSKTYHLKTSIKSCINLKIGNVNISKSTCEKRPAVKVDNKLNFN